MYQYGTGLLGRQAKWKGLSPKTRMRVFSGAGHFKEALVGATFADDELAGLAAFGALGEVSGAVGVEVGAGVGACAAEVDAQIWPGAGLGGVGGLNRGWGGIWRRDGQAADLHSVAAMVRVGC